MEHHPERGIIYLENRGKYKFYPYLFSTAARNQWNTMAIEDFDGDGDKDVIIGAMNLSNVLIAQKKNAEEKVDLNKTALIIFKNNTY